MRIVERRQLQSRLSLVDLSLVRICALTTRLFMIRRVAIALSWLGNGWIYAALSCLVLMFARGSAFRTIGLAAVSIGLLHSVYPVLKRWFRRPRPFAVDASLEPLLPVLDKYSFPSGHMMTLSASLVPTVMTGSLLMSHALALWLIMAWARIASAHHYLTDVLAGSVLGLAVSYPISYGWLQLQGI